jgi:hypothetical protein
MKTNDLKKSTRIKLRSGWEGTILDNKKGNTRLIDVEGDYREIGSCYSHDIVAYKDAQGNWQTDIEYTESQMTCKKMNFELFGG